MSDESTELKNLNKLYGQIVKGYSIAKWEKQTVYLKHFGISEQFYIQQKYDDVYTRAKSQGLPGEKEVLETLDKEGVWTATEEKEITDHVGYVEGLRQSRKHLIIPSQVEQLSKQLGEAEEKLVKLQRVKNGLLKDTCESFSENRSNDYSVYLSFCRNEECESLFTNEEFEDLDKRELYELVAIYNESMGPLDSYAIKKIALAPFFVNYFNLSGDNPGSFFGTPVAYLTYFQVNLLNYGRVFRSIMENVPDIPDYAMEDPDKLLDYAESSKKTQESRDRAEAADGYSVVGANEGDLKTMGLKDGTTKSIFQLAKEKGGNLSLTDFK